MATGRSVNLAVCRHIVEEIEGENVCKMCGQVLGYVEVAGVNDWETHNLLFSKTDAYFLISKLAKNLYLPFYAVQTMVRVTSEVRKKKITKKEAILYATVYACRIHNIPRLLEDIFYELENASGRKNRTSEKSLLKLLNRIAKKIENSDIYIHPPTKDYYLQAYLAKIQKIVVQTTDERYFEMMRVRSLKLIESLKTDPSTAAKEAILKSTSRVMESKVKEVFWSKSQD